jgi:hypothetical protein
VGSNKTKFGQFWMGDGLNEGEADTSDLRCIDKGTRFETGVRGRPGGEYSETMLRMDGSETGGNSDKTELG